MKQNTMTEPKSTVCHHCGGLIAWNATWPDKRNSHWAHAILVHGGKAHSIGNALMEQRCANGRTWATPKRAKVTFPVIDNEPDSLPQDGSPAEYGDSN